jgi:Lon protease-like protein
MVVVSQGWSGPSSGVGELPLISLGCLASGREPMVQVVQEADGSYRAELQGQFQVRVSGDEPFRIRLLILFLRWLEVPAVERTRSRRTRDGRAPFVRQRQVADWFGVAQPHVSRWEGYWLAGDWANLLSLKAAELLTREVRQEIIAVCAAFPWWGEEQVHDYLLRQHNRPITARQVRQTVEHVYIKLPLYRKSLPHL